jgi:hypothetical protein
MSGHHRPWPPQLAALQHVRQQGVAREGLIANVARPSFHEAPGSLKLGDAPASRIKAGESALLAHSRLYRRS